jgi:uncharacterized protein (DUF488 family)
MSSLVFTIGHSVHPIDRFADLLAQHGIDAIADVRSSPYSRFSPQFRREQLEAELRSRGVAYVFLGRELGARREEPEVYDGDLARYDRIAQIETFARGIERVEQGAARYRVALMCAEKDPLTCHRALLVARALAQRGHEIGHVHADGTLENAAAFEQRLLTASGVAAAELFRSREELVAEAYCVQGERMGYRRPAGASRRTGR